MTGLRSSNEFHLGERSADTKGMMPQISKSLSRRDTMDALALCLLALAALALLGRLRDAKLARDERHVERSWRHVERLGGPPSLARGTSSSDSNSDFDGSESDSESARGTSRSPEKMAELQLGAQDTGSSAMAVARKIWARGRAAVTN